MSQQPVNERKAQQQDITFMSEAADCSPHPVPQHTSSSLSVSDLVGRTSHQASMSMIATSEVVTPAHSDPRAILLSPNRRVLTGSQEFFEHLLKWRLQQEHEMVSKSTREVIEHHRYIISTVRDQLDFVRRRDKYSRLEAEHSKLQAEHGNLQAKYTRLQEEQDKIQVDHRTLDFKYTALDEAIKQTLCQRQKENKEHAGILAKYENLTAAHQRLLLYVRDKPGFSHEVMNAMKDDNDAVGAELAEKNNETGQESGNSGAPAES
ncbi:hypothetical protein LTR84_006938 [Exophiala bonariae]|uniref:SWI5-dependent HO expression protein 3 n=1 Tax=Exophiala bonariae TaxID=1690606 RepID=A0AAV9MZF4_9EURO|nr:hypothetical protein LTR84_006938 [Exophiala bonariae]